MRRPNRHRLPPSRPKLAFEPLESRDMLAADAGLDWWAVDTGYEPAADDWVWTFDDSWTGGGDGTSPEDDGSWMDNGTVDPAADLGGAADIDAPAVTIDDVAPPAQNGADPDASFIEDPVVIETPAVTDDTPTVQDELPIVTDDPPVSDDQMWAVTDDQPVVEDVPAAVAPDDTAPVGDPVADATPDATPDAEPADEPAAPTPEPVAGPDPVPSEPVPVPDVPKTMDTITDGPRTTWTAGPDSAESQPGSTVVSFAAPTGSGRTTGTWGRLLGIFGLPGNADASPPPGLQASGQDGTGKPRVRLPFRPAA